MSDAELDDFFGEMSPSEIKNYSEMIFKQQPVDIDLNREVLNITASMEHLPDIEELSKKCYMYRCELLRVASELQMQRDIYRRFLKMLKAPDYYTKKETRLHQDFRISYEELSDFAISMDECIAGLYKYAKRREISTISEKTWSTYIHDLIGKTFHTLKGTPAEKSWTPLAPIKFDDDETPIEPDAEIADVTT